MHDQIVERLHAGVAAGGRMADLRVVDALDDVVELQREVKELFLRVSPGPEHDRLTGARDGESGFRLPGLPAVPLRPERWWEGGVRLWVACQFLHQGDHFSGRRRGRRPWLLTGTVLGHTVRGEPLVGVWSPVALIGPRVLTQAGLEYAAWRGPALVRGAM